MDVWRITVAVLRRWYVFLPLLGLSGLGAYWVGQGVDPQYEVDATAILVPGTAQTEITSPYGNISDTTQVLTIVLDAVTARDGLAERGLSADYAVSARDRSSILNVSVLSGTPQESLATAEAVFDLASAELAQRQGAVGIPPEAQIGLQVLRPPSVSDVVTEGKARNMAVVGIVGAALSMLVAILFDDIVGLVKRRRRRGAPGEGVGSDHTAPNGALPSLGQDHSGSAARGSGKTTSLGDDVVASGEPDVATSSAGESRGRAVGGVGPATREP